MGWGDTAESDDVFVMSNVLMETDVNMITNEECERSSGILGGVEMNYNNQITENMFCAKDVGEDSCQGDSGGPLVWKSFVGTDVQVGVGKLPISNRLLCACNAITHLLITCSVSWGFGCAAKDFPGIYSRVSSATDWIKQVTCRRSVHPPEDFDCDNLDLSPTESPTEFLTFYPTTETKSPTKSPSPTISILPEGMKSAAGPKGSEHQEEEFDDNSSMLISVHFLVAACIQFLVLQSAIA